MIKNFDFNFRWVCFRNFEGKGYTISHNFGSQVHLVSNPNEAPLPQIPITSKFLQILKLDDHLQIDNFKKVMRESVSIGEKEKIGAKNILQMAGEIEKVQDYFNKGNDELWDKWIELHLKGTDIMFPK